MAKVTPRTPLQRNDSEVPQRTARLGNTDADEMRQTQARQMRRDRQRTARKAVRAQTRNRLFMRLGGAVLVAAILVVGIVLIISRQGANTISIGMSVPSEGSASHVPDGSPLTYKHYPPSSGHHYASPAPAGFSTKAISEGNWVHSLEHGYVVILYKPSAGGTPTDAQLRDIMATFPKEKHGSVKIVITPYDHMDSPITAVAWERQLSLDQFDRAQLLQFYQAYVDHGPEDVP